MQLLGGLVLVLASNLSAGSGLFLSARQAATKDPPDTARCQRAETKVAAGSCADLYLGCGTLRVCCESIVEGAAKLSLAEIGREVAATRIVQLTHQEIAAFPFRRDIVWIQMRQPAHAESTARTVIFSPHPCPATEEEKIESLISLVESMTDTVFIRNGKEYSAAKAAEHLRSKYAWKKDEIATATDFIDKVATRSSASGKEYEICIGGAAKSSARFMREMSGLIDSACGTASARELGRPRN